MRGAAVRAVRRLAFLALALLAATPAAGVVVTGPTVCR